MYQNYRPSGKTAWYFIPLTMFCALFPVTVGSGLCRLLLEASPGTMWEIISLLVCGGILIELTARCCMELGKARSAKAAWFAGILNALVFWYLLFVFGAVFFSPGHEIDVFRLDQAALEDLFRRFGEVLRDPAAVAAEFTDLLQRGAPISGNTGTVLFLLKGTPLAVIIGILCAVTVLFTGVCFYMQSREPFCEKTGRWCRSRELYFTYIENQENFINRLLLGDFDVIRELEPLRDVNSDYALATLYSDEEVGEYYISIENKRRKEDTGKNNSPRYEDEEVVEFVQLDRDMGRQLLSGGENRNCPPVAEVENRKTKLKRFWRLAWRWLILAADGVILFMGLTGVQSVEALFHNGVFLFYAVASVLVAAINFFGSLGKRYVVKTEEDEPRRPIRQYETEREERPAGGRIFNIVMFLICILLTMLCIRRM